MISGLLISGQFEVGRWGEACLPLEILDKTGARGYAHTLGDGFDGVVAIVLHIIHASARLADAILAEQGLEVAVSVCADGA